MCAKIAIPEISSNIKNLFSRRDVPFEMLGDKFPKLIATSQVKNIRNNRAALT
jgi:hypothetical protein